MKKMTLTAQMDYLRNVPVRMLHRRFGIFQNQAKGATDRNVEAYGFRPDGLSGESLFFTDEIAAEFNQAMARYFADTRQALSRARHGLSWRRFVLENTSMHSSLGWAGKKCIKKLQVTSVPGDHLSMLKRPHVASLAREFDSALRSAGGTMLKPTFTPFQPIDGRTGSFLRSP